MKLVSATYAIFIVSVYFLYLSLNHKRQNRMLLAASYLFYSFWDPRFVLLLLISTTTDFFCAQRIYASKNKQVRNAFLWVSILVNLGILGFFKYFNFFIENMVALLNSLGIAVDQPTLHIILPIGISFYTFQTLCYTIDVHRKQVKPTTNWFDYALYVAFFPQLLAGPIERASNLLPQILRPRTVGPKEIQAGFFLAYWGLFKKTFVADNLGYLLRLFASSRQIEGADLEGGMILITTYVFMFQLYADFSAYSDLAKGVAKMMGFDIMTNFRTPFFAPNVQELPKRWHISLTSWVLDYVYYPLALKRWWGKYHLNAGWVTIVTFMVMGIWHGPSWNYLIWGAYYGALLVFYNFWAGKTRRYRRFIPSYLHIPILVLSILLTFHSSLLGFLFFKSPSLQGVVTSIYMLFANFTFSAEAFDLLRIMSFYVWPLLLMDFIQFRHENVDYLLKLPTWAQYAFLYVTAFLIVKWGAGTATFVYFQF